MASQADKERRLDLIKTKFGAGDTKPEIQNWYMANELGSVATFNRDWIGIFSFYINMTEEERELKRAEFFVKIYDAQKDMKKKEKDKEYIDLLKFEAKLLGLVEHSKNASKQFNQFNQYLPPGVTKYDDAEVIEDD